MRKIVAYILRRWDQERTQPLHPGLKILPPFFYEILGYLLAIAILYQIGLYLFSLL